MNSTSRVRFRAWTTGAAAAMVMFTATPSSVFGQAQKPEPKANTPSPAVQDFQKRLNGYVEVRTNLAKKLKPLSPTANAAELTSRQESLAAAIRAARKGAKQGDLIPTSVATQIRTTVQSDLQQRKPEARRATVSEVADGVAPVINRAFPASAALPTIPPLLLEKLPVLPDNLQYRFLDRHLVLLDGDTQIIIDYVPNVLPPH